MLPCSGETVDSLPSSGILRVQSPQLAWKETGLTGIKMYMAGAIELGPSGPPIIVEVVDLLL